MWLQDTGLLRNELLWQELVCLIVPEGGRSAPRETWRHTVLRATLKTATSSRQNHKHKHSHSCAISVCFSLLSPRIRAKPSNTYRFSKCRNKAIFGWREERAADESQNNIGTADSDGPRVCNLLRAASCGVSKEWSSSDEQQIHRLCMWYALQWVSHRCAPRLCRFNALIFAYTSQPTLSTPGCLSNECTLRRWLHTSVLWSILLQIGGYSARCIQLYSSVLQLRLYYTVWGSSACGFQIEIPSTDTTTRQKNNRQTQIVVALCKVQGSK